MLALPVNNIKPPMPFTHDKFFKTMMSDMRIAREFFSIYLPDDLLSIIDLDQLSLAPKSFINDIRKETTVDLLFKTKAAGQDIYLLVEHQSSGDVLMPFRITKYSCNIMDYHLTISFGTTLPLVYPIVVYHGRSSYRHSNKLHDLVKLPREIVDKYLFKPFQLIDLNHISFETLKQYQWSGAMQYALKRIFVKDIEPHMDEFKVLFDNLRKIGGGKHADDMVEYLATYSETKNPHIVLQKFGEPAMPIYEMWKEQGREEGREEGFQEGMVKGKIELAKQMLQDGIDANLIMKYIKLPI